ncbi:MAG: DUF3644 domain-containing protein [Rhodothermaceae bacterium]|nr:DUF3644 domain-containing protein [Rhodothermaceae bacterium]MYC03579.1 DUF3644 domain-containing protein [Rhodothermaceae bacterium]
MPETKRNRRVSSITGELVKKSQEAALSAVQIFNSPLIKFRAEIFIVLMHIAWTYLLHAYYRRNHIGYRYYDQRGSRKFYHKTSFGAYKYWGLKDCLEHQKSPVDKNTKNNLFFLIGLRNEIEHQMTRQIDDTFSAKFQACCFNYNQYIKQLFGEKYAIDHLLGFSLHFSSIKEDQVQSAPLPEEMPSHIHKFIRKFEDEMSEEEFDSPKYAYRVIFLSKTVNRRGQADRVIEFIPPDSPLANEANREYAVIKEREKPKYLPSKIVRMMNDEGFGKFTMHNHTILWKSLDAKKSGKGYGVWVTRKAWFWYDRWVEVVRNHCQENDGAYKV